MKYMMMHARKTDFQRRTNLKVEIKSGILKSRLLILHMQGISSKKELF